jgi:hypothetical protein
MKPANDLQTVAAEVRELAGIAVYGQVRLSELSNQILRAEEQLISVSSLNKLSKCYESLEQYHSALQASFKAITDWKAKVEQDALYICNAAHHQLEDNEEIDLTTLEFEATELLRMFTKQLGVLQQRQEKVTQLLKQAQRKRKSLTPHFEKGKTPVLGLDAERTLLNFDQFRDTLAR